MQKLCFYTLLIGDPKRKLRKQLRSEYSMKSKTVSSASDMGNAGQLHVNQINLKTASHHMQK